jgi:hypothetical protein
VVTHKRTEKRATRKPAKAAKVARMDEQTKPTPKEHIGDPLRARPVALPSDNLSPLPAQGETMHKPAEKPAKDKASKGTGTVFYHLICRYHADLADFDDEQQALDAAAEHLAKFHADSSGNVSPTAEMQIVPGTHFTADDLKARRAEQKEQTKGKPEEN